MMRASQFVGRQAQLEHIQQHLYPIMAGQPRVVFMQGVEGVGKTRFLEQIRMMAMQFGLQVSAGGCDETLTQPYTPYADLFARLEAEQMLDDAGQALLRARTDRAVVSSQPDTIDRGESGKLQLMMTVARATIRLALRTPVLLLIDDLHLANPSSLDLLTYLAFSLAEQQTAPLLLLGCYRPVQAGSRLADS